MEARPAESARFTACLVGMKTMNFWSKVWIAVLIVTALFGLDTTTGRADDPPANAPDVSMSEVPLAVAPSSDAVPADFEHVVGPFLTTHCLRCHGPDQQDGEFRLDTLSRDFTGSAAGHWGDVMYRISTGEMPPEDEPRPSTADGAQIVEWLNTQIKAGELARLAQRERVSFQKLTREEYANTIYDLLGVRYDATDPSGLPEDPNFHGFERIGSVLSLSPAHVEKYFAAAESCLAEAFPITKPETKTVHWGPTDFRGIRNADKLRAAGLLEKARLDVWAGSTFTGHPGSVQHLNLTTGGDYRLRIKLSGLKPPRGRAPHLSIYAADLDRMLFEQDVIAPEAAPVTLETVVHLAAGQHVIRSSNEIPGPSNLDRQDRAGAKPFYSLAEGRFPWQRKLTDEQGEPIEPFLIVDWVEWEGPLVEAWPTMAQETYPFSGNDKVQADEVLRRFVERAFRRPARLDEVERFESLRQREITQGESPESALRTAMLAVLCSKDFFYIVEGRGDESSRRITDHELATRLSYFLWNTMPDAELLALADNGTLHQRDVLKQQVARMLRDPRIGRFTNSFSRQWLQLRGVGMFPPDKMLYPNYDEFLETSMIEETTHYFREVLGQGLSLREFLDSDWTTVNARLAIHYGLPQPTADGFQRVLLTPDSHRGGLLTQAAILSVTSDGTRHRPVHRGKWVLESILGRSPPPPPANVKPVEPTPSNEPKATLRMKLAAHQNDATCAACHQKIDPLGFAFDHYDAIGRWRTEEVVKDGNGENPPIDASGRLPDGREFVDAEGLKQILLMDIDQFNQAFLEKLSTYALRRVMTIDDREELAKLADQSRAADYRLDAIVEALILSDLFQSR